MLARCKLITDIGIGYMAVGWRKLRLLCLKWCIRVTDLGVGFITMKCKELQSLDLSCMPIIEKCLSPILQLQHLEDLVLKRFLGIDDEGLATLNHICESLKTLNLSKCQNISRRRTSRSFPRCRWWLRRCCSSSPRRLVQRRS
ncbi:hypothetical protein ACFX2F_018008 [Malus domestica]